MPSQFTAPAPAHSSTHHYPNVERRHLTPADAGLDQIGHFGYFKPSAQPLWGEAISWLNQQPHR